MHHHIKDCSHCHKMVTMGAGVRLLHHLQTSHRLDDKVAMAVVNWVFNRIGEVQFLIQEKIEKKVKRRRGWLLF